ncbi:MAG: AAA family ATPase, partial [Leptospira sp.]|nr:AAA family ATPase [Leptospira sp.]
MFLKFLSLQNFRNHDNLQLQFDSELVFLIGGNGEGKTNILEAIGIFSNLKSFRESSYDDIIGWGKEFFFIKSDFITGEESNVIEIGYEKVSQSKKRIKLNGEVIKKKVDIVGKLKSIIFSPA